MQHAQLRALHQPFPTEEIGHGFHIKFDVMEKQWECSDSHLPPVLLCSHAHACGWEGRGGEGVCVYVYLYIFDLQAHEATRSCTGSAQRAALSRTEAALWIERVLNSCQTDFGKPWATFVSLKLRQRWNTSELKYTWLFCLKKKNENKENHWFVLSFPFLLNSWE